jgi:phosphoribosylformimino-5-aminoimidazole carboxamide ribotide isomerase
MEVIPVIDLKGGVVVHARAGDRKAYQPLASPLVEGSAPGAVVQGLLRLFPFRSLYVADLDAIEGRGDHDAVVARIAELEPSLDIWVDKGIGSAAAAAHWLERNPGRLVIGSESQHDPSVLAELRGDTRVVLSLDFRGEVFQGPKTLLDDIALWPKRLIVMTLARVGSGAGPDLARFTAIAARAPDRLVYAAGGVRNVADLRAAEAAGACGALIATALHSGAISAADLQTLGSVTSR